MTWCNNMPFKTTSLVLSFDLYSQQDDTVCLMLFTEPSANILCLAIWHNRHKEICTMIRKFATFGDQMFNQQMWKNTEGAKV